MRKQAFAGKSMALFIGLSLLIAAVSFGSSREQRENSLMWDLMKDGFSLVKSEPDGLKWDCLVVDSTETGKWTARPEIVRSRGIDADKALISEESSAAENTMNRGKLAFVIRAGAASITAEGYGSSLSYGVGLFIRLSERIGLEIVLDKYSIPVSKELEGMGTGKMQVTPFLLSGQWRFPMGRFVPYASLGAGFYFIHFEPDGQFQTLVAQDLIVADRFALHLGGGVDVHIIRSLDFCADLRYSLIKTWIQARDEHHVKPADQDLFNLNTLVISLGLRYYF